MSFQIEQHTLLRYRAETPETEVLIPDGVEILDVQSFFWSKHLEILTIPASVREIRSNAFRACRQLKEIRISEGIPAVEKESFRECWSLHTLRYREFSLLTNCADMPAVLKMIAQRNCRASVPNYEKYSVIGAMFFYHPEEEKMIKYIQKDFRNLYQNLIEENQILMMEKILQSGKFITGKNIDEIIRFAIENKKYEIQTMLISYKNQHFGYDDITEKLKL